MKDGDKEQGTVKKGKTDVTYIYKLVEEPENPTQPENPQTPNNTPKPNTPMPGKSASLARIGVAIGVIVTAAAVAAMAGAAMMFVRRRRND